MAVGPLRQLDQGWTTGTRCCFGGPAPREPLRAGPEQRDVHYTLELERSGFPQRNPTDFPKEGLQTLEGNSCLRAWDILEPQ